MEPVLAGVASDGLWLPPKIEHFAWRVEQLVQEGGFALLSGESGTGKSVALRIVAERVAAVRDVLVGVLQRPQSKTANFDREWGDIFAVKLRPANRYGGFKVLRERWRAHLASSRIKPVLLIDEAQEMAADVLGELRLLSSADFDATSLWTVVLAGDGRLLERLRQEDLIPLGTRIRTRLKTANASREELLELLSHALTKAGNATRMTAERKDVLVVAASSPQKTASLAEQVLALLTDGVVLTRAKLRELLGVKNERLGQTLQALERGGQLRHSPAGRQRADGRRKA